LIVPLPNRKEMSKVNFPFYVKESFYCAFIKIKAVFDMTNALMKQLKQKAI
jgi:hypothetical protein